MDIKTYRVHNNGAVRNFHATLIEIYKELEEDYNLSQK